MRAFEVGFGIGAKPIDAGIAETVLFGCTLRSALRRLQQKHRAAPRIAPDRLMSIARLMKREKQGKLALTANSVVYVQGRRTSHH